MKAACMKAACMKAACMPSQVMARTPHAVMARPPHAPHMIHTGRYAHQYEGYTMLNQVVAPPSLAAMLSQQRVPKDGVHAMLAEHGVPKSGAHATPKGGMHAVLPKSLAVLKIDIDSCDCDVLEAALVAGYKPSVIDCMRMSPASPTNGVLKAALVAGYKPSAILIKAPTLSHRRDLNPKPSSRPEP